MTDASSAAGRPLRLVDSHCNLHMPPMSDDPVGTVARAREQGVEHILTVTCRLEDFEAVIGCARRFPGVTATVGVHPTGARDREPDVDELVRLGRREEVVAIGETGLDYHYFPDRPAWQRERFARHVAAARELRKPLVIHTRHAGSDTIDVMRAEGASDVGGVMHCFTSSWKTARRAMDLGFHIAFSGIVTFHNADNVRAVARRVPVDRMLLETDAPYLAPVPYRGHPNEPAWVHYVAIHLAELLDLPPAEFALRTSDNFHALFPLAAARGLLAAEPLQAPHGFGLQGE